MADGALPAVGLVICHVTLDCNLRCSYCFSGHRAPSGLMSEDTAVRAAELVARRSRRSHLRWIFFGGEPLLAPMDWFENVCGRVTRKTAEAGASVSFGLQTNATMIDQDRAQRLKALGINPSVSLDGPAAVNDLMRSQASAAIGGIRALQDTGLDPTVLMVLGPHNGQNIDDCLNYLADLGIRRVRVNTLSEDRHPQRLHCETISGAWQAIMRRVIDNRPPVELTMLRRIHTFLHSSPGSRADDGRCCGAPRCGAARNHVSVTPDGSLYPCDRAIDPRYRLGVVGDLDEHRYVRTALGFHSRYRVPSHCASCPARTACDFGCTAARSNGEFRETLCRSGWAVWKMMSANRDCLAGLWQERGAEYERLLAPAARPTIREGVRA